MAAKLDSSMAAALADVMVLWMVDQSVWKMVAALAEKLVEERVGSRDRMTVVEKEKMSVLLMVVKLVCMMV